MKGLPKTLNSKQDYLYLKENTEKTYYTPLFQALLDSRFNWFFEKPLENKSDGTEDETHKIVENTMGETPTFSQYVLQENKAAKIYKLGFTVKEIEKILK